MSTNRLSFSELFYHKSSALRVELNTFKDKTRFKFEIIPALKDEAGNPVISPSGKPKFDYNNSFSMLFNTVEILRIKKIIETILNPNKQTVPAEGYVLEHYFEVNSTTNTGQKEKKKSILTCKRMENNYKPKFASPFEYKYVVGLSIFSSAKNGHAAIVLSEDESYWLMNMLPLLVLENIKENGRIQNENKPVAGENAATTKLLQGPGTGTSVPAQSTPVGAPVASHNEPPDGWEDDIPF